MHEGVSGTDCSKIHVEGSPVEETGCRQEVRAWLASRSREFIGFNGRASTADDLSDERCCLQLKASTSSFVEEGKLDAPRTIPGLDQAIRDRGGTRS